MFSSIISKVESFVDYWQESNVSRSPHNFSNGVWVRDLPGVEGGVTYNAGRIEQQTRDGITVQEENQRDIFDGYQEQSNKEIIVRLRQQINGLQRREESALSALDLLKEQLTERDEYLQLLTAELKAKNIEIDQKNQRLYEYEIMLEESRDTIRQLEQKFQCADIKVTSLEKELEEKEASMAQLKIKQQSSQLEMQEKYLEKENELQRLQEELRQYDSLQSSDNMEDFAHQEELLAIQKNISEENAFLREQCHNLSSSIENATEKAAEAEQSNNELRRKLAAKNQELKQLQQQFLEYQKERLNAISKAIAILQQRENGGADAIASKLALGPSMSQ